MIWPVGGEFNEDVCYHHCHRGDGGKVLHTDPCCKVCRFCLLNIKTDHFNEHKTKCRGFDESEKK